LCDPGKWTKSHTPETCKSDELKAAKKEKEKKKSEKEDHRPAWQKNKTLKADAHEIIIEEDPNREDEEKIYYHNYDSENSVSTSSLDQAGKLELDCMRVRSDKRQKEHDCEVAEFQKTLEKRARKKK
jgi:hypothetical protein